MTLNQIKALFKAIGNAHFFIKSTEFGEVQDKIEANSETIVYPAFYQVPTGTTVRDIMTERTFQLILCDLVDPAHRILDDVLSDTEQYINDIVRILREYSDDYTLLNDPVAVPFKDGFGDAVAGYYVEITIETDNTSTLCNIPTIDFGYPGYPGDPGTPGEYPGSFDCNDLLTCPIIEDIENEIEDLDIRVTALEQGSGGGNFIPLSGTVLGSDITGPLNYANNLPNLLSSINGDNGSYLIGNGTQTQLINYNTATNNQAGLIVTGTQFSLASIDTASGIVAIMYNDINGAFQFSSSNPNSGGLIGNQDFSLNYDPLSFVQRTYVENNYVPISISTLSGITSTISNLGPRILSTVTDTINNNTTVIDHRSNRYTLSNNLSSGLSSGFVLNNGTVRLSSTNSNTADLNDLRLDALSFDVFSQASSGSYFNITGQNTGSIVFEVTGINDTITVSINENDALVGSSDYSAFYSAFSFVQKIYVDNAIAGITPTPQTLAQTLAIGNTTGANNIVIDSGQLLTNNSGLNYIALNNAGTPDIKIQSDRDITMNGGYININPSNGGVLSVAGTGVLYSAAISTTLNMDAQLAFSTNSGNYRSYIYVKDTDQTMNFYTVNSNTIFYNGPGSNQYKTLELTFDNHIIAYDLAGTGTRMVVADLNGQLSTQAIPSLTGYVPYTGATTNLVMGANTITTQSILVNGTAGLGYIRLNGQSTNPTAPTAGNIGGNIFFNGSGNLGWNRRPSLGSDTFTRTFTGNITANRSYILPDVAGTIALTSNITTALTPYQNSNVITASVNTNITTANMNYVFNGTTATFTLPALANNKVYNVANIGSGNLTINSGSVNIFDLSTGIPVNTLIIPALNKVQIIDNGTYFIIG